MRPGNGTGFPRAAALAAVGLFVWGVAVALHYGRMGYMPLDQSIVFDGGYRLLSGQLPYRDFMTPAAVMPAALQAVFFRLLGVTWFAYVLHAAVVNGLFAVLVLAFLTQFELRAGWAGWWAALSALTFYPPIGVPYAEHHAFFFAFGALVAGNTARRARLDHAACLLGTLVAMLVAAAFFSKASPTVFLAPLALGLPLVSRSGRRRMANLCGMLIGTGITIAGLAVYVLVYVPNAGAARRFAFDMPAAIGAARIARLLPVGGTGWSGARTILAVWPMASLTLAMVVALLSLPVRRHGDDARIAALLAVGLAAASAVFALTTQRSAATAAVYVFLVPGLAQASLGHSAGGLGGAPPGRSAGVAWKPPAPLATAVLALFLCASALEAWRFNGLVNEGRAGIVLSPIGANSPLPAALSYLRWMMPAFVPYTSRDLAAVADFFASHAGNFFLLGDSSILYAVTGRPSTSPVLWFHPHLTVPFAGCQALPNFDRDLLRHLEGFDVRYIVLEGDATQMGVSLASFPMLARRVEALRCDEESHGGFRIITLCNTLAGRGDGQGSASPGI
jgi:hypothetical protein